MKRNMFSILLLTLIMASKCSPTNGFFISAPRVFHVGVNEKVFVQMGQTGAQTTCVTLYLEREVGSVLASEKKNVECAAEGEIKIVDLMIDSGIFARLSQHPNHEPSYLVLVAESPSFPGRKTTRVLVSKHRGNIFIQTDQPVYNPMQIVRYRIFSLNHNFRPHEEVIQISVFNAAGNKIMTSLRNAERGIFRGTFHIPEISKFGTWKITAHYEGSKKYAASREFRVQKFVLPSFEVNIAMTHSYILLNSEQFEFTISAKYSHGENVEGSYHCYFGVVEKAATPSQSMKPVLIKGMERTGSVKHGTVAASIQIADLNLHLQNMDQTLSKIQQKGSQLYLRVIVTNNLSGEMQEAEVYIPIISHKYIIDLSRTRTHFIPGYPLNVVVHVHLPDGSPAANVPLQVQVSSSNDQWRGTTNQEGAAYPVFNLLSDAQTTVEVSADGVQQRKVIHRASSPSGNYLYLSFTNNIYSVGDSLTVTYNIRKPPAKGYIYSMVLSRGRLIKKRSIRIGISVRDILQITADMVPSFRLIAYFYDKSGAIIADSVWVNVKDKCEIDVKVTTKGPFIPGKQSVLEFDLHGKKSKVALLAIDKAFYALHADNKLTAKQVFSSMQLYDGGCPYSGGSDPGSVLTDAGLSFVSDSQLEWKNSLGCHSQSARQSRSVDLQQEMMTLKSNFSGEKLQKCCVQGFAPIPMQRTCQERVNRVAQVEENPRCMEVFLTCCLEGERLRHKKIKEDALKGLGRTLNTEDIELFFLDTSNQYIRRYFPPSFAFTEFDINGKGRYSLSLPDSITTWEVQVITLSEDTGFCVVEPSEVKAFKNVFVSLRLPYSVRKYEQLAIAPIIYNYGHTTLQVAVHMEQAEGLCSPGSATSTSFVNITVQPTSSQFVSFSSVPMVIGSIPIKIRLYDIENDFGLDAIEKTLNVLTEGLEKRVENTLVFKLDGRSTNTIIIDGSLPDATVPDSSSSIFISVEEDGFHSSQARNLLSPSNVAKLIELPKGCLEQTMIKLAPTASAMRYLDLSNQWFDLPPGSRDDTLTKLEKGYIHILGKKNSNGSYGPWRSAPQSNWITALVVKVLSSIAERQIVAFGGQGRTAKVVPFKEISESVSYLLSVQMSDGSFGDPNPILHRGVLNVEDRKASMTAFITIAIHRSLQFLTPEGQTNAEASISRSTAYLLSHLENLNHPYAVAITAYCLAVCLPKETDHSSTWKKLQTLATEGKNGCYVWTTNARPQDLEHGDAITVDSTSYALLAAVELRKSEWADKIACWLTTQENYLGGFKSTQDTINALEALAEYELKRSDSPPANAIVEFRVAGKNEIEILELKNRKERVETDLKKFIGNDIKMDLTGNGNVKLKVYKAYHILEPKSKCSKVSISVTVEGKVKYTAEIVENYDYYDYGEEEIPVTVPKEAIEGPEAHAHSRRDLVNEVNVDEMVTYRICVSHSLERNLTGMAIADITLLSGFEVDIPDLEMLKAEPEQYISHYEAANGRVLLYFNQLFDSEECISFDATQRVPIGLLQPAPAVFYDYYEPDVKCTVFYSAPKRSKLVSKLCSEDVCQCAERPCHKIQNTFQRRRRISKDRSQHACFFPIVDYAYIVEVLNVSMKSNFEMYNTDVKDVLRLHGDILVNKGSVRVFAKRRQCKGQLELGKEYLIMGKDGHTTDSDGMMQYLLESNTWVERKPLEEDCKKSAHRYACMGFVQFTEEYKIDGCRQ